MYRAGEMVCITATAHTPTLLAFHAVCLQPCSISQLSGLSPLAAPFVHHLLAHKSQLGSSPGSHPAYHQRHMFRGQPSGKDSSHTSILHEIRCYKGLKGIPVGLPRTYSPFNPFWSSLRRGRCSDYPEQEGTSKKKRRQSFLELL